MDEYIEREAFIADKQKQYCSDCDRRKGMKRGKIRFVYDIGEAPCRSCGIGDMLGDIEDYPSADVKPVVHGHWIWAEGVHVYGVDSDVQHGSVRCSACGNCSPHSTNYCGYCGADMRGDDDDNV